MRGTVPAGPGTIFYSSLMFTVALALGACSSVPMAPTATSNPAAKRTAPATTALTRTPSMPAAGSGRGGYYQEDGPGDNPPTNLLAIPDAEPKLEPLYPGASRPYMVFGKTYTPIGLEAPLKQRGTGSWYGKKFHGQKTSSGERYDMYKMTAAHPTMPLPSYARVTNLSNGKQVIVRVNDRGPFHSSRIIDLSYTAALKLGYLGKGSTELEVERLLPEEIARMEKDRRGERAIASKENPPPALMLAVAPDRPATAAAMASLPPAVAALDAMLNSATPEPAESDLHRLPPMPESGSKLVLVDTAPEPVATLPSLAPRVPTTILTTTPASTPQSATSSYYLQIGAFSQAANADAVRSRLQQAASDTLAPLEVVQSGAVFRLFSGPFSSRIDATLAAQKLQDAGQTRPFVVQR